MLRRSTANFYTHFLGDVVSDVESSHGVLLSGRSTGGIVEAFGDDTNIGLTVRSKNVAPLTVGNSSNTVDLVGSSVSVTSTHVNFVSTLVEVDSLLVTDTLAFTGTVFRVQGASSIVLSPTSTAGITIGNSSAQNAVMVSGSSMSIAGNGISVTAPSTFSGTQFVVQGASSIVLSPTSTAGLTIGNSSAQNPILITASSLAVTSTHVNLNSTRVNLAGGSTSGVSLVQRYFVKTTLPEMSSGPFAVASSQTIAALTTNSILAYTPRLPLVSSAVQFELEVSCSTAGSLHQLFTSRDASTLTGGSTFSGYLLQFRF